MPTVILAGHCGADTGGLQRWATGLMPGIEFKSCSSVAECQQLLEQHPQAVAWVNRIFDRTGESTLDWMQELATSQSSLLARMAMITNFDDVQQQATGLGAMPGFGKSRLNVAEVKQQVLTILGGNP